MRRMLRLAVATFAVGSGLSNGTFATAPATPSYQGVERTIEAIRQSWSAPGRLPSPTAPGGTPCSMLCSPTCGRMPRPEATTIVSRLWITFTRSRKHWDRWRWHQAANLREETRQWLRPRLRLAWARRRLSEVIKALPPTTDTKILANRDRWVDFEKNDLGNALRDYDGAATLPQRQAALHRIHESLNSLDERNKARPWWPSNELEAAVNDLFNRPNVNVSADAPTVEPLFNANLINTGPVYRKGYVSQVTAGPKTGFGLLSSDDGIAFFNRQSYTSVTPIWDFQNQIASNPQGQRAARLYQFSATTYDWAELTFTTVLKDTGLEFYPTYQHAIDAGIASAPTAGGGLGRTIASLVGLDQEKINEKVYEGSIGQFRQRIPAEAQEEAQERHGGRGRDAQRRSPVQGPGG